MDKLQTLELDFEEFSYVNGQRELQLHGPSWLKSISDYLFENFGAISVQEIYPYIIVYCEDKNAATL